MELGEVSAKEGSFLAQVELLRYSDVRRVRGIICRPCVADAGRGGGQDRNARGSLKAVDEHDPPTRALICPWAFLIPARLTPAL